jgi:hypothetical protein
MPKQITLAARNYGVQLAEAIATAEDGDVSIVPRRAAKNPSVARHETLTS